MRKNISISFLYLKQLVLHTYQNSIYFYKKKGLLFNLGKIVDYYQSLQVIRIDKLEVILNVKCFLHSICIIKNSYLLTNSIYNIYLYSFEKEIYLAEEIKK